MAPLQISGPSDMAGRCGIAGTLQWNLGGVLMPWKGLCTLFHLLPKRRGTRTWLCNHPLPFLSVSEPGYLTSRNPYRARQAAQTLVGPQSSLVSSGHAFCKPWKNVNWSVSQLDYCMPLLPIDSVPETSIDWVAGLSLHTDLSLCCFCTVQLYCCPKLHT